jgi:hypothetical protein
MIRLNSKIDYSSTPFGPFKRHAHPVVWEVSQMIILVSEI